MRSHESHYFLVASPRETWIEWSKSNTKIEGFPESSWGRAQKVKVGDYLLCYCTSPDMMFIGVERVESTPIIDRTVRYSGDIYPVRFRVSRVYWLGLENGLPVSQIRETVPIWQGKNNIGNYFHPSLRPYDHLTGEIIVEAIQKRAGM